MDTNLKTKSRTDVAEQFGDMVEKGATQSKEALEKMSAATGQAADVVKGEGFTMTKPNRLTLGTPPQAVA